MESRLKISAWIKVALTAALLILLFWRTEFRAMINTLGALTLGSWLLNLLWFLFANLIAAAKWKLLLGDQRFTALLKLNFIGQYYAMLLPGQVAGEVVKAYRLGKGKQNAEQIAASVIIDRITGFLGLLGVGIVGAALNSTAARKQIFCALLFAIVALLALLFFFHLPWWTHLLERVKVRGLRATQILGQLRGLLNAWKAYAQSRLLILVSVLLGACFQLIAVWINYQIGRELGLQVAISDWCWVFGVVSIVTALPFTIGGLGLREGSFIGSLALLGIAPEKAMGLSFAVFSLLLAGAAIGGVLEWTRNPSQRAQSPLTQ
jgi:glycosyltransferase 2 family protein